MTGARRTGWQTIKSGKTSLRYYFDSKGVRQTGLITIDGKSYYLNESGVRQHGYLRINGQVYYADKSTGVLGPGQMEWGSTISRGKRHQWP